MTKNNDQRNDSVVDLNAWAGRNDLRYWAKMSWRRAEKCFLVETSWLPEGALPLPFERAEDGHFKAFCSSERLPDVLRSLGEYLSTT